MLLQVRYNLTAQGAYVISVELANNASTVGDLSSRFVALQGLGVASISPLSEAHASTSSTHPDGSTFDIAAGEEGALPSRGTSDLCIGGHLMLPPFDLIFSKSSIPWGY